MLTMMDLGTLNKMDAAEESARGFVEIARAIALGGSRADQAFRLEQRLGARSPVVERFKAAVDVHSTSTTPNLEWARLSREFLQLDSRRSVLGQLGAVRLPPNMQAPIIPTGSVADFVREGSPTPVARLDVDLVTVWLYLLALIVVVSRELLVAADTTAMMLFGQQLRRAIRIGEEQALLSDVAAVAGERPAGLLHGLAPVGNATSFAADLAELWETVREGEPERPVYIVSARGAAYLAEARLDNGAPTFPALGPGGGSIGGVPVVISRAAAHRLILVDAAAIGYADGGAILESSNQALVEMDDAPSGGGTAVSLFQKNLTGVRVVRFISWTRAADDAVAFLELPIAQGSPN
jgi:HK97 family phage major capsid protein